MSCSFLKSTCFQLSRGCLTHHSCNPRGAWPHRQTSQATFHTKPTARKQCAHAILFPPISLACQTFQVPCWGGGVAQFNLHRIPCLPTCSPLSLATEPVRVFNGQALPTAHSSGSTWRRFSCGHSACHTLSARRSTSSLFRCSRRATSRAKAGASRRLRAMLYPVAGCTRLAAAPKAVRV